MIVKFTKEDLKAILIKHMKDTYGIEAKESDFSFVTNHNRYFSSFNGIEWEEDNGKEDSAGKE